MGEPPQLVRGRPLGVSPRSRQGECGIPPRFGSAITLAPRSCPCSQLQSGRICRSPTHALDPFRSDALAVG